MDGWKGGEVVSSSVLLINKNFLYPSFLEALDGRASVSNWAASFCELGFHLHSTLFPPRSPWRGTAGDEISHSPIQKSLTIPLRRTSPGGGFKRGGAAKGPGGVLIRDGVTLNWWMAPGSLDLDWWYGRRWVDGGFVDAQVKSRKSDIPIAKWHLWMIRCVELRAECLFYEEIESTVPSTSVWTAFWR